MTKYSTIEAGYTLAYNTVRGTSPGVLFLGGLMSDMEGTKALALESWCKEQGRAFLRFDYFGHGQSDGAFSDGRIGMWHTDVLHMLDSHTAGPQIIVGSSMGGWQMLLAALARPERVAGLVGIAAAPDFARELMWEKLSEDQQEALKSNGIIYIPSDYGDEPYPIRYDFISESDEWQLMDKEGLAIDCPIRLLHGMQDVDVPWQFAPRIAEKANSTDVQVLLSKSGDHRLSNDADIARLIASVEELISLTSSV